MNISDYLCFSASSVISIASNFLGTLRSVAIAQTLQCYDSGAGAFCNPSISDYIQDLELDIIYVQAEYSDINFQGFTYTLQKETLAAINGMTNRLMFRLRNMQYVSSSGSYYQGYYIQVQKMMYRSYFVNPFEIWLECDEQVESYQDISINQYLPKYPPNYRNLQTAQNSTNVKKEKDTQKLIPRILYICSNLGGLYIILFFILGTFLRPILDKLTEVSLVALYSHKKFLGKVEKSESEKFLRIKEKKVQEYKELATKSKLDLNMVNESDDTVKSQYFRPRSYDSNDFLKSLFPCRNRDAKMLQREIEYCRNKESLNRKRDIINQITRVDMLQTKAAMLEDITNELHLELLNHDEREFNSKFPHKRTSSLKSPPLKPPAQTPQNPAETTKSPKPLKKSKKSKKRKSKHKSKSQSKSQNHT
ncbi:unnamed protein product [Moneuplotes crassus]|uniref:Uncharacterized protein n=1 Tax=Euplotes crassus TaxID=5936 RepID=A0AAD1UD93_EUPCR|nr:unnamed protein product [Moneuplotes crassus]